MGKGYQFPTLNSTPFPSAHGKWKAPDPSPAAQKKANAVDLALCTLLLARHRDHNIHFADAYLAAAGAESGLSVASFDRDLDKFKDVRRFEPKA
jgi:hypothetical protein